MSLIYLLTTALTLCCALLVITRYYCSKKALFLSSFKQLYETFCAIWYHLYNLKNMKNTHGGMLLLVKLQALAYNFTKSNTPPWVFFTFLKLYKWNRIAQSTTNMYTITLGNLNFFSR